MEKMKRIIIPLTGFHCSEQEVQLGHGFRIRRASTEEKRMFRRGGRKFVVQPKRTFFVVEKEVEKDHVVDILKTFDLILLGLDMIKGYLITEIPVTIFYTEDAKPLVLTRSVGLVGNVDCSLKKTEVVQFIQLLEKLVDKRNVLRVPLERFIRAQKSVTSFKSETVDSIIDLMIAFEALILSGEKIRGDQGKHIAIATSMLIGTDEKERLKIKECLKQAYKSRNEIVHGTKGLHLSSSEEENLKSLAGEISTYFKSALLKLL